MTDAVPTTGGYLGAGWLFEPTSQFNEITFMIEQVLAGRAFCGLVLVKSVSGGGASATPPIASVQPMVDQIDGLGNRYPHGTVYNIPCLRLQGGAGAVVLDPLAGDIGAAIICHRDSSTVQNTGAISGPGSRRQNDWADGLYLGGFLNGAPTTYVAFGAGSLSLVTPTASMIIANGTIATTGILTNNGVTVGGTHEHSGVMSGGSNTGPPT